MYSSDDEVLGAGAAVGKPVHAEVHVVGATSNMEVDAAPNGEPDEAELDITADVTSTMAVDAAADAKLGHGELDV